MNSPMDKASNRPEEYRRGYKAGFEAKRRNARADYFKSEFARVNKLLEAIMRQLNQLTPDMEKETSPKKPSLF